MEGSLVAYQVVEELQKSVADVCGTNSNLVCQWVFEQSGSETSARVADWLVDRPLRILFILVVAWIVVRILRRIVRRFAAEVAERSVRPKGEPEEKSNPLMRTVARLAEFQEHNERAQQRAVTLGALLESLVSIVVWTTAVFLVLGELGVSLGPLIASAGIAGIAIGFGAQTIVRDFLAGIFVIVEDQYGVGDIIDVSYATGKVEEVGFRTTRIRDFEGVLWTVPNGEIRRVGNYSQVWSRSLFDFKVSYDTDIDHASSVIKGVLDEIWRDGSPEATIIAEPEVLGVEELATSAVVIRARVTTDPSEQFKVARIVRAAIKKAFDDEGIEMPFDQQTVWLRGGEAASEA